MKPFLFTLSAIVLGAHAFAQTYAPVNVTGYNLDAIAESAPASSSTTGSIDGSDYVLYTSAYGSLYSTGAGLPDNGTITNGLRTYQMNPMNEANTCFVMAGLKDSITFVTPAPYSALSLLGLATEGPGNMNVTVKFTDGTSQVFNSLVMPDWFYNPNAIISGFDRTGRFTDSPDYQFGQPNMYAVDLVLTCANRSKSVSKVVIQNTTTNPRICVFAVSAVALPTYSVTTTNINCGGPANGSATLTVNGGIPAYSYTWTTNPVQNTAIATNLAIGNYTATLNDAIGCTYTIATAISQQALVGTATITASSATLCAGNSTTLTASGATSYTWSTSAATAATMITPTVSGTYSVAGTTAVNCLITGSISITVNPLPSVSFSLLPNTFCSNSASVSLNGSPAGGMYSGAGITGASFSPVAAGVGTHTISYSYTDANNCMASTAQSATVSLCTGIETYNSNVLSLYPNPNNGTFTLMATADMQLIIFNELGQEVMAVNLNQANNYTLSIENLAKGMYMITGQTASSVIKQKVLVSR